MGDILAGLTGLCTGVVSGGALCAFYIALGIFSKSALSIGLKTSGMPLAISSALGGLAGTVMTLYNVSLARLTVAALVFGLFAGIYVGIFIACLAEVTDMIPVTKSRGFTKRAITLVLMTFVIGKLAGSLAYWLSDLF